MSDIIWSIILIVGLFGWVASTLVFIFKAFPELGRFEVQQARKWGLVVAVSFIVWIVGLLNA